MTIQKAKISDMMQVMRPKFRVNYFDKWKHLLYL